MKKKRGRRKDTGVLTGIKPERETWEDIRNRIIYGSAEWPMIKLRPLILALKCEQATTQRNMLVAEQKACRDEKKLKDYAKAIRESNDVLAALEQGDEKVWTLADNFLSAHAAEYDLKAGEHVREVKAIFRFHVADEHLIARERAALRGIRFQRLHDMRNKLPVMPEILAAWRILDAQFERAVLNGDAEWFDKQAKAIRWKDARDKSQHERAAFNAKVLDLLEIAMWGTRTKQRAKQQKNEERWKAAQKKQQIEWEQYLDSPEGRAADQWERQAKWAALVQSQKAKPQIESATLTPGGKFTDAMASDIYKGLDKRELPNGHLIVEGCRFENKARVMEAIHDLAKQIQFALRKQH